MTSSPAINSRQSINGRPYELERLKAEKAKLNFSQFVIQAWRIVEPGTPFVYVLHIEAICLHLQVPFTGER
jgi:hypothetical protein